MFQVELEHENGIVKFGPPVGSLDTARAYVKLLDWLLKEGELPPLFYFYTRRTVVRANQVGTRRMWDYVDGDPSGTSDGVWFVGEEKRSAV